MIVPLDQAPGVRAGPSRKDTMFDPTQYLAEYLLLLDPLTAWVFRVFLGAAGGAAFGVLLAAIGCTLAQCCRGDRRRGIPTALGVVGILCLVGGVDRAAPQTTRRLDSIPEIQPRLERLFWADSLRLWGTLFGRPDEVSLSPDSRWIALSAFGGTDRVNLWLASVATGEAVRLSDGQHMDQGPVWFPDGNTIAFSSTRPGDPHPEKLFLLRMAVSPETGPPWAPLGACLWTPPPSSPSPPMVRPSPMPPAGRTGGKR
jgi:hypothetical protein